MDACRQRILVLLLAAVAGLVNFGLPESSLADAGDDQYTVAASHYSAGRWQLAEEEFAKLVSDHPQHRRAVDALFFHGEAHMQLRNYGKAVERFDQLLARAPEYRHARQAMFRRGEAAHLAGNAALAEQHLQAFLDAHADDSLATYALPYLAATKLKLNDRSAAESLYGQATTRFPDGPLAAECWLRLGVLRFEAGQYNSALRALQAFEKSHRQSPLLAQVKYWQGTAHAAQQDWDEAAKQFNSALNAKPSGPWADNSLLGMIRVAAAKNDHKALQDRIQSFRTQFEKSLLIAEVDAIELKSLLAQKNYERVITTLQPRLAASGSATDRDAQRLRFQLAMAYTANNQQDEALVEFANLFDNAGQLDTKLKGDAILAQAAIYVERKNYAAAIDPLASYLDLSLDGEHTARCLGQLAICLLKTGDPDRAKTHYETLCADHSSDPLFLATTLELAETSMRSGDSAWAKTLFEQLASSDNSPDYVARGIAGQAWCECLSKDLAASARLFQQLLEEYPNDPMAVEAALARAQLLQKLGRNETALRTYQLVIDKYAGHANAPQAMLRVAQLQSELGHVNEAEATYRKLLSKHGTAQQVAEARYGLAWLHLDRNEAQPAIEQFQALQTHHRSSTFWPDATFRLAQRAFDNQEFPRASHLTAELVAAAPEEAPTTGSLPSETAQVDSKTLSHALYLQGQIAVAQEHWTAVDAPLTRLLIENPESMVRLPAEYWLAEAAYRREAYELAEQRFDTLSKKIGGRDDTWLAMVPLRRAQLLAQKKQWREATDTAKSIAVAFPNFGQQYEADYLLGRCWAAQADFDRARAAYNRVIASPTGKGGRSETAAMAQWMIGETYLHQKNYDSATRAYLRVPPLYAYPRWQAAALLQAGKCHEYRTEWDKAVKLYERVNAEFPDTMFAEQVAERLQIARQRSATPSS